MTTGRINQVATSSRRGSRELNPHRCSLCRCGIELRPCISFAIVLYHSSAPAPAPECGLRQDSGLCCTSAPRFNLSSEHRRAAPSGTRGFVGINGFKNQVSIQLHQKRIGHPETGQKQMRSLKKAKKETQARKLANQEFA